MEDFKKKYSFNKRKDESKNVIEKYPDRIPIIVQKHKNSDISDIDKCKYLYTYKHLFIKCIIFYK